MSTGLQHTETVVGPGGHTVLHCLGEVDVLVSACFPDGTAIDRAALQWTAWDSDTVRVSIDPAIVGAGVPVLLGVMA